MQETIIAQEMKPKRWPRRINAHMTKFFQQSFLAQLSEQKSRVLHGRFSEDQEESQIAQSEARRIEQAELVVRKAQKAMYLPWSPYPKPFFDFMDQLNGGNRSLPVVYPVFADRELFERMHLPFVENRREWMNRVHAAVRNGPYAAFVVLRDRDFLEWCRRKGVPPESFYVQGRFMVRAVNWLTTALVTGQIHPGERFIPDPSEESPFWRVPHSKFLASVRIRPDFGATYLGVMHCHLHPDESFQAGIAEVNAPLDGN